MIPKGTLLVMPTNTGYEDATNPMHTIGPIMGDPPHTRPITTEKTDSSFESKDNTLSTSNVNEIADENNPGPGEKKVGVWEAGTGRMFDPDRWIKDGVFDPHAGPSLPFSLGQRGCFGKNLAVSPLQLTSPAKSDLTPSYPIRLRSVILSTIHFLNSLCGTLTFLVDGTPHVLSCP